MTFQFLCPQGHLLQGEESLVGQQCKCPYCECLFIVPAPNPPPGQQSPPEQPPPFVFQPPGYAPPPEQQQAPGFQPSPPWQPGAGPEGVGSFSGVPAGAPPGVPETTEPAGPSFSPAGASPAIVHILCPSGHELETPREMLGQDALCPYCQVQFRLRYEHTVEYRRERLEEMERKERKAAKLWLEWSIGIAVFVLLGVITLIVLAAQY